METLKIMNFGIHHEADYHSDGSGTIHWVDICEVEHHLSGYATKQIGKRGDMRGFGPVGRVAVGSWGWMRGSSVGT